MLITAGNRYGVEDGDQYPLCKDLGECGIFADELDSDGERVIDTWAYWDCLYDSPPYLKTFTNDFGETDEVGGTIPVFIEDLFE